MAINARNRGDDGCKARPRRGLFVSLCLALWLPAAGAWAAEVVDVRIGAHPGFTRIVFELDATAGYRVERATPQPGVSEVVVSIDATSIPRELQSSKSLVSSLRMVPKGAGSVAHVRVVKDGLRLKQMILASPPRIVLDVLAPAVAEAKPPSEPRAESKVESRAESKAESRAEPKPVVTAPVRAAEKPAPAFVPAPAPTPAPAPVVKPAPAPPKPALAEAEDTLLDAQDEAMAPRPDVSPAPVPSSPAEATPSPAVAKPAAPSGTPMRPVPGAASSTAEKAAKPMTPGASTEQGMGMGTLGGLLALLALGAVAVLVFLRRRAAASEAVASEFEGAGGENPFAGLGYEDSAQPVLAAAGEREEESEAGEQGEASPFAGLDEVETPDVDAELGAAPARRTAIEIGSIPLTAVDAADVAGRPSRTAVAGDPAGSDEVTRMMREFERRLASLETRFDEVVDARERLERQVAAQTEELRVQRAAIARTQRAVRNLTRGDEDIATEPAPRDPERPRGGD